MFYYTLIVVALQELLFKILEGAGENSDADLFGEADDEADVVGGGEVIVLLF